MIGLAVLGSAFPVVPFAQQAQPARLRRIGLVIGDDPEGLEAAFREALRSQGYIEGQNLLIEVRTARNLGLIFPPELLSKADRVLP
jgi:hypothetical protein